MCENYQENKVTLRPPEDSDTMSPSNPITNVGQVSNGKILIVYLPGLNTGDS